MAIPVSNGDSESSCFPVPLTTTRIGVYRLMPKSSGRDDRNIKHPKQQAECCGLVSKHG